jgi:hypothetical protein
MNWPLSITAVTILVAAAVISTTHTGDSAAQPNSRTITLFEAGTGGTLDFVDNPPRSPATNPDSPRFRLSVGDQGYWTGIILDRRGGKRVGSVIGAETVVKGKQFPKVENIIHAIFKLSDGQIVVDAVVDEAHPEQTQAAIIGGTGAYEGARGTFTTKPGKDGNQDTLRLIP